MIPRALAVTPSPLTLTARRLSLSPRALSLPARGLALFARQVALGSLSLSCFNAGIRSQPQPVGGLSHRNTGIDRSWGHARDHPYTLIMAERKRTVDRWLIFMIALPFLIYGWPGLWLYGTTQHAEMYRINRFTGTKEWADEERGWMSSHELAEAREAARADEIEKDAQLLIKAIADRNVRSAHVDQSRLKIQFDDGDAKLWFGQREISRLTSILKEKGIEVQGG